MHYLIRMEPFTTLHIQLQSGKYVKYDFLTKIFSRRSRSNLHYFWRSNIHRNLPALRGGLPSWEAQLQLFVYAEVRLMDVCWLKYIFGARSQIMHDERQCLDVMKETLIEVCIVYVVYWRCEFTSFIRSKTKGGPIVSAEKGVGITSKNVAQQRLTT